MRQLLTDIKYFFKLLPDSLLITVMALRSSLFDSLLNAISR
ncbi:MAG: hypothetical protein OEZ39_13640 [Gammaproteobacteria bacterium]|nr:hypothetical protein [Gammaproteobacteria bacterium]MDH5652893.1 hypothetical protein [Gammaproteobacteria bacterium]